MPVFSYHLIDHEDPPPNLINIMRPHRWSNRFVIGRDGDRNSVLAKYKADLWEQILQGKIALTEIAALDGANLKCCCGPLKRCHGDILLAAAKWAAKQLAEQKPASVSAKLRS